MFPEIFLGFLLLRKVLLELSQSLTQPTFPYTPSSFLIVLNSYQAFIIQVLK